MMFVFSGCFSFFDRYSTHEQMNQRYRTDKDAVVATEKLIVEALNAKDPQMLKCVFSKAVIEHTNDLDIGIDYLFSLLDSEIIETYDSNFSATGYYDSGKKTSNVSAWCYLRTETSTYNLSYVLYSINESTPEKEGVYRLNLYRIDDAELVDYDRYRLAGIDYQEREYAHKLANDIVQSIQERDAAALQKLFDEQIVANVWDLERGAHYLFDIMSGAKVIGNLDSWITREETNDCNIYQAYIAVETDNGDYLIIFEYSVDGEQVDNVVIRKLMLKEIDVVPSSVATMDALPDRNGIYYPGWNQ